MGVDVKHVKLEQYLGFSLRTVASALTDVTVPYDKHIILVSEDITRPNNDIPRMVFEHVLRSRGHRDVTLVVGNGMHRAFSMDEVCKKFGNFARKVRVLFNNPQCGDDWLKKLKKDTNGYVVSVTSTMPHMHVGMSGGNKVIVPCCAHWSTVSGFHKSTRGGAHVIMNRVACDIVDYHICYVIDAACHCIAMFSGSSDVRLNEFKMRSRKYYKVTLPEDPPDAVLMVPTIKNFDFQQCMNVFNVLRSNCSSKTLVKSGGIIGILANPTDGMGVHYLFQAVNGIQPVSYDDVYANELRDAHLVIISNTLPEVAIQDFFRSKVMVVKEIHDFEHLVESKFYNPIIYRYLSPEIMIGV